MQDFMKRAFSFAYFLHRKSINVSSVLSMATLALLLSGCMSGDIMVSASNRTDSVVYVELRVSGPASFEANGSVGPGETISFGTFRAPDGSDYVVEAQAGDLSLRRPGVQLGSSYFGLGIEVHEDHLKLLRAVT